jgi:hypothetical protein
MLVTGLLPGRTLLLKQGAGQRRNLLKIKHMSARGGLADGFL